MPGIGFSAVDFDINMGGGDREYHGSVTEATYHRPIKHNPSDSEEVKAAKTLLGKLGHLDFNPALFAYAVITVGSSKTVERLLQGYQHLLVMLSERLDRGGHFDETDLRNCEYAASILDAQHVLRNSGQGVVPEGEEG